MAAVVLMAGLSSLAQGVESVAAPADVVFELETEGGRQFHLGELIPIKFSYRSGTPGRYFWVNESSKLAGGHTFEISCSPDAERVRPHPFPYGPEEAKFHEMLYAGCPAGVGGASGGGCSDCDWEAPLTATGLSFAAFPLNMFVRFRVPGDYTCQASSAQITATFAEEKIRPALLAKSNSIVLKIVGDSNWAQSAASAYAASYDRLCRGDDVAQDYFSSRLLRCFEIAERITYLDTPDSLATEVRVFDGRTHGWENGFWEAIQHSSQPREALRLMTSRMQDSDVQVSVRVLEWLASSELKMQAPDAFQGGAPGTYHQQALEILRNYVQLLGKSLSKKDFVVRAESTNTYRSFAQQQYCEDGPLISPEEQNQILPSSANKR